MKHKKHILTLLYLASAVSLHAQDAVTAAGGSATVQGLSVSWSIGEAVTETFKGATLTLTQGVQQPQKIEIVNSSPELPGYTIAAYPNPASDYVTVSVSGDAARPVVVRIFDSTGRICYASQIADSELRIPVSNLPAGMYVLQLTDKKKNIQTFKLIKK